MARLSGVLRLHQARRRRRNLRGRVPELHLGRGVLARYGRGPPDEHFLEGRRHEHRRVRPRRRRHEQCLGVVRRRSYVVPALSEREKKESNRNNRNDDMESQSSREGAEKEKNLLPVFPFPSFFCPLPSLFEREKTTFHRQSKNVHNSSGRFSPPPP